ncbi:Mobile element protein, partial [uncultured Gammaproteobacteria bacterium]
PTPEIFNTDQGSQYTSEIHTKRLKDLGITISMDGKGRATDNVALSASGEAQNARESI